MEVGPLTDEALAALYADLSPLNRAEFEPLLPEGQAPVPPPASTFCAGFVLWRQGRPHAAFGVVSAWPGTGGIWGVQSTAWPAGAVAATKGVKRVLIPAVRALGIRRAELRARLVADLPPALAYAARIQERWLHCLGCEPLGPILNMGRRREHYRLWVWNDVPEGERPQQEGG